MLQAYAFYPGSDQYSLNDVLAVANDAGVTSVIQPLLNDVGCVFLLLLSSLSPCLRSSALGPVLTVADPLVDGLLAAAAPILSPILTTANDLGLGSVLIDDLVRRVLVPVSGLKLVR